MKILDVVCHSTGDKAVDAGFYAAETAAVAALTWTFSKRLSLPQATGISLLCVAPVLGLLPIDPENPHPYRTIFHGQVGITAGLQFAALGSAFSLYRKGAFGGLSLPAKVFIGLGLGVASVEGVGLKGILFPGFYARLIN